MNLKYNLGLATDPRSSLDKVKDYKHSDVVGAPFINWIEKPVTEWKKYLPREQDGSLSCCGQGSAKAVETFVGKVMSAHPIYRMRSNYPEGGMYLQDVGNIWKNYGSTLESLDKSQWLNETKMNLPITVPTPDKMGGYVFPNCKDINEIADSIEIHKHCILIFHCNKNEWTSIPKYEGDSVNFGHCVCAVDYFTYNGKKVILIEDSTGHSSSFDKNGQRLITEDFLKARCDGAMYLTPIIPKPPYFFTKTMRLGDVNDEVKMLQIRLNIGADGKFGLKTKAAVILFQTKNNLVPDGIVGKNTRAVLNA